LKLLFEKGEVLTELSSQNPIEPSIRVVMMPKDTNAHGTIFGGVILSYIDQAAAVEAKRHGAAFIVTIAMREVVFHEPVYVGDLVSFYTRLIKIGKPRSRSASKSSRSAVKAAANASR